MVYARWSDDCFQSDVYVYLNNADEYVIHVAAKRAVSAEPRPAPPATPWSPENAGEWAQAVVDYNAACARWVEGAEHVAIGLPCDGQAFYFARDDALSCAEKLHELREMGYYVPDGTIEAILEEARPEELGKTVQAN